MRLFFLGTGSAEGFPALFSDTEINREALRRGGRNLRSRSTIVVDGLVKVDLPPDSLAHVHRFPEVSLAALQYLLFTHSHDDHFAIRELQYLSPNFAPARRHPLNVYAGNELIRRMIPEMSSFFEAAPVRFHSIASFEELVIGHLTIVPVPSRHKADETCFNFVFRDGASSFLYATDTGWYREATWRYLEGAGLDVVVLECGKGIGDSVYDGHLSFEDCVKFRVEMLRSGALREGGRIYLTHICPSGMLLHEELVEMAGEHGMDVAWDGLELVF